MPDRVDFGGEKRQRVGENADCLQNALRKAVKGKLRAFATRTHCGGEVLPSVNLRQGVGKALTDLLLGRSDEAEPNRSGSERQGGSSRPSEGAGEFGEDRQVGVQPDER